MDEYLVVIAIELLYFLLLNIPLAIAAYSLSQKVAGNIFPLKIAMTIFFYLLQGTVIFAVLGMLGKLDLAGGLVGAVLSSVIMVLLAYKLPAIPQQPLICMPDYSGRFMNVLLIFMLIILTLKTTVFGGTDSFLYHIFYPAMWLENGRIYSISLTGLPHEYFPFAGEVMYGWLMLPGSRQAFVTILQPLAFAMALAAITGLWQIYRVPQVFIKAGVLLFASAGIIQENLCLTYTDALTGAFFAFGITLMLIAFKQLTGSAGIQKIFAACAGIALGLTAAIKYSGLIMAPISAFVLLLLFSAADKKSGLLKKNQSLYWIFSAAAIFSAIGFYLPNWLKTGNPFYPVKIPFLFSNGIDFERPAVKVSELWSFYVNKNIWDINIVSAIFFLITILAAVWLVVENIARKKNCGICNVFAAVLFAAVIAETVMITVYPAMTGARQIIPFLSAVSMLMPGVLYLTAGKFVSSKKSVMIFVVLTILIGFFTVKNTHTSYSLAAVLGGVVLAAAAAAFLRSDKAARRAAVISSIFFVIMLIATSWVYRVQSPFLVYGFAGSDNYEIIMHLRREYVARQKTLNIASCGYLFNYMLMWDMLGNKVFSIPINQAGSTHPHDFPDLADWRENTADCKLWLERLKTADIDFLVIDLKSHQDFASNRDAELKWAKANPEIFELIHAGNGVYLFEVKK